ncbi:class I SAM-dependent methyltransferase [Streptacidiphilus sp. P02-A3a]|uniref:class I SAM-dependent methyltransferase n=1 Tax=Streptacidiphilus sp. P02-A3a TaxID=2704468 RepID=UPI0015FC93C8|nr:class I SAM-dependent methyltransferase [Streptacidiphilus sp. P02-A3a]QMU71335.1 class I SAM-dependent methyltransferase [Streptacidiphilus sp. P02-A3a]
MNPVLEADPAPADAHAVGYVFDNDSDNSIAQFRNLSAAYDPFTTERLAATGLGDGWSCLEIGAGNGSVAAWLADRVAPTGRVLATDTEPRRVAAHPGLRVERHDIVHDPLAEAGFDLAHARLVLQHLPERQAVLRRLRTALRPGGWLQIDEFDVSYGPVLTAPDERSAELYRTFLAAKGRVLSNGGARIVWGRECAAEMRAAGFTALDPQPRVVLWQAGHPGLELLVSHTHSLRERLLAEGLTDDHLRQVREVMRHPEFQAVSPILYSVQGRRPA